jgi:hypothetical protein
MCVCVRACVHVWKKIEGSDRGSRYTCCNKYKCYFLETFSAEHYTLVTVRIARGSVLHIRQRRTISVLTGP